MRILVLLALIGCVRFTTATPTPGMERFDEAKVYKIMVHDDQQLHQLRKLGQMLPLRNLRSHGRSSQAYEVAIDASHEEVFETLLRLYNFSFDIIAENLQKLVENCLPAKDKTNLDWTSYHYLKTIYKWLDRLVVRFPRQIRPFLVGFSHEGRPIKGVKIAFKKGTPGIVVDSNIHAVERISSASSTCFIERLLTSKDPKLRHLRDNYTWYFTPILNPDGYEYTFKQPLWRKNRKYTGFDNSTGKCYGTDLNRNFDFQWKVAGYNVDVPCDHWYGGNSPASEPEVKAYQNFLLSLPKGHVSVYVTMHSYGNMLLLPYGHTEHVRPANYEQSMRICKGFADAAFKSYGTVFRYGSSGDILYPVAGSSKDWAHGVAGIPFSITLELRDEGKYGFFLPPSQIIEVCDEVTDGFIGMIDTAEAEHLFA